MIWMLSECEVLYLKSGRTPLNSVAGLGEEQSIANIIFLNDLRLNLSLFTVDFLVSLLELDVETKLNRL